MESRDLSDDPSHHLLRERTRANRSTKARLDMADGNPPEECGQACRHRGGRVALDDHDVRAQTTGELCDAAQNRGCDLFRTLIGAHQIEIVIRNETEEIERLIEHLPVLSGHANGNIYARARAELGHDRREFDRFRSGSEYDKSMQ